MKRLLICLFACIMLILSSCAISKDNMMEMPDADTKDSIAKESNTLEDTTESDSIKELTTSPIGGADYCFIHHHTYHAIPGELIDFVISTKGTTEAEVYEWLESATVDGAKPTVNADYCNLLNIKMFFDKYAITEEEFYNNCSIMNCTSIDVHMLRTETNEAIEEYFRNVELLSINTSREAHYRRISILIREAYDAELEKLGIQYTTKSVPELVHILSIDRDNLIKYIAEAAKFYEDQNGVCYTFDYNLDMIYGTGEVQAGNVSFEPLAELLSVNEDDDPNNDISSGELNEMFCRVGRYAE